MMVCSPPEIEVEYCLLFFCTEADNCSIFKHDLQKIASHFNKDGNNYATF